VSPSSPQVWVQLAHVKTHPGWPQMAVRNPSSPNSLGCIRLGMGVPLERVGTLGTDPFRHVVAVTESTPLLVAACSDDGVNFRSADLGSFLPPKPTAS
jgi:hypothetical protein